jgi:lysozyme
LRGLILVLLALTLASCGGSSQKPPSGRGSDAITRFGDSDPYEWEGIKPWQYPVHGVDVSRYQGDIDWARVRASGTSFAFIKATEGGDVFDSRFDANWQNAKAAGVARGAYHYYYFCRTAVEQANWFIQNVPKDRSALPPVLDMEWTHRSRTCRLRPAPHVVRREMGLYLNKVTRHYGKRPVIYTTVDFYAENELWLLKKYNFWLRSVADHPSGPYPDQRWTFWQYTGTGVVPGISGNTDINVFSGSQAQWRKWARKG